MMQHVTIYTVQEQTVELYDKHEVLFPEPTDPKGFTKVQGVDGETLRLFAKAPKGPAVAPIVTLVREDGKTPFLFSIQPFAKQIFKQACLPESLEDKKTIEKLSGLVSNLQNNANVNLAKAVGSQGRAEKLSNDLADCRKDFYTRISRFKEASLFKRIWLAIKKDI